MGEMAQDARRYTSFCVGYKAQGFTGLRLSEILTEVSSSGLGVAICWKIKMLMINKSHVP